MPGKPAARLGDIGSAHGCFPPTPTMAGSADVFINGRPAIRVGDPLVPHGCSDCSAHPRSIAAGAGTVSVNGRAIARVTDAVDCGGQVQTGSSSVFVGDEPRQVNTPAPGEWSAFMQEVLKGENRNISDHQRQRIAAATAVAFRGPPGGVASWQSHYEGKLRAAAEVPLRASVSDPLEREGLGRALLHDRSRRALQRERERVMAGDPMPSSWPGYAAPASVADAHARLAAAQARNDAQGYRPRYDDATLLRKAAEPVSDRYLVRVLETRRGASQDLDGGPGTPTVGELGPVDERDRTANVVRTRNTSFEHIEAEGSDTRRLVQGLGMDPDPEADYAMALIDRDAAAEALASETVVPTDENVAALAGAKDPNLTPERAAAVLNDEYRPIYAELRSAAEQGGYDLGDPAQLERFAGRQGLDAAGKRKLRDRVRIEQGFGATSDFPGDGLARSKVPEADNDYGAVETLSFDNQPKPAQALVDEGIVSVQSLPSVAGDGAGAG